MSDQPQRGAAPTDSHRGLRLLGLVAVALGVLVLMAAAFVLSYTGIHAIALSAGVSARFARIYPVIFDAMLVVACAAVLALRGAGLPSRCYAWLTMLVLLAAAAGADTVHATNTKLPHKPTAAAAAIIPWVLVLLGFGLLLSMLRHARLRRAALAGATDREFTQPSGHVEVQQRHGLDDLFGSRGTPDAPPVRYVPPARPVAVAKPVPVTKPIPVAEAAPDLAIDGDPGHDDPSSDEGHPAARIAERQEQPAGYRGNPASAFSPAPTLDVADEAEAGTVPVPRRAPSPAPQAKPVQSAEPAANGKAPRPAKTAADTKTAGDAKTAGKTKPAASAAPEAGTEPTTKAAPVSKARSASKAPLAPQTKLAPEAEPLIGVKLLPRTGPAAARAEATTVAQTGTATEPPSAAELTPTGEPELAAGDAPDAEPAAAAPVQFDRVRSSPVPPEA